MHTEGACMRLSPDHNLTTGVGAFIFPQLKGLKEIDRIGTRLKGGNKALGVDIGLTKTLQQPQ